MTDEYGYDVQPSPQQPAMTGPVAPSIQQPIPESTERGAEYAPGDSGMQVPGQPTAPPLTPDQQFDKNYNDAYEQYKKDKEVKKPGAASQVLFHIAQGMTNFARGMMGQSMQPHEDLTAVRTEAAEKEARRKFEPIEQERKRRIEEAETKRKVAKEEAAIRAAEIDAKIKQAQIDNPDREYKSAEDKVFSRPKGAKANVPWDEEPQLGERDKKLYERELPGTKEKVYLPGKDIIAGNVKKEETEAARTTKKQEIQRKRDEDYKEKDTAWQKDKTEDDRKRTDLQATATEQRRVADAARKEAADYKQDAADATNEGDLRGAAAARENARKSERAAAAADAAADKAARNADSIKTRPRPTKDTSPIDVGGEAETGTRVPAKKQTVNTSTLKDLSKKTGKSIEELKKMAEAEGYEIK
jgi:hypothetical protein